MSMTSASSDMKKYIKKYWKHPLVEENSFLVAVSAHEVCISYLSLLLQSAACHVIQTNGIMGSLVLCYLQALLCCVVKATKLNV